MSDPLGMADCRRKLTDLHDDLVARRITMARFQRKSLATKGIHGPVLVIMLEESWNQVASLAQASRVALRRTQRATEPSRKEPTL